MNLPKTFVTFAETILADLPPELRKVCQVLLFCVGLFVVSFTSPERLSVHREMARLKVGVNGRSRHFLLPADSVQGGGGNVR